MDGILNLLKPPGMTSSDAVVWARRQLQQKRIGHAGTLDPQASGVLPLCVGRAARLFDLLTDKQKVYRAQLCLGVTTDTQDAWGRPLQRRDAAGVTLADVRGACQGFVGDILQTPPAYSAVRVDGRRLYEYARLGQAKDARARPVRVERIEALEELEGGFLLRVTCGRGTYIRTLCHDIGAHLGVGGHMGFLLREQAGPFTLHTVRTVEEVLACPQEERPRLLAPPDAALGHLDALHAPACAGRLLRNGNPLPRAMVPESQEGLCRLYYEGALVGVAVVEADAVRLSINLTGPEDELWS